MNKKAIATQVMIIVGVFFFTIAITTGTLFLFGITGNSNKQTMVAEVDSINYGTFLLNYLRTPTTINDINTNIAELIIYATKNKDKQLLQKSVQNVTSFFSEIKILDGDLELMNITGAQNLSQKEKIILTQVIPNYFNQTPTHYTIKIISEKHIE